MLSKRVLSLVDDDESMRTATKRLISSVGLGVELQSRLTAANSKVPIVFISGHGDGQERARALEAGAIDFLQKPFSEQDLFKAISPFVGDAARVAKTDGGFPGSYPARPQLKS